MLKIKHSQLNWLLTGMTLAVMGVSIAPASAQSVIVIDGGYGVRQSPAVGSFIYGSPIPTPMPVDPATGLISQRNHYRDYSYPQFRQNLRNSTLINPTYPDYSYPQFRQNVRNFTPINPTIRDSTLVNPVIINNSWRRTPFSGGRSRVIITYPR
ncbi:hypothetical protein [Nostoc sp. LPT]|uniref:hypothetical protein n=1 Tax=Nostoc sp. LPT TaxID=2815387 RepID=UPI001D491BC1|nr:hypothetical protein [Nostoc sp. LPT]MBN4006898.1 hypothetical protein [Nostoc sp. LPT]